MTTTYESDVVDFKTFKRVKSNREIAEQLRILSDHFENDRLALEPKAIAIAITGDNGRCEFYHMGYADRKELTETFKRGLRYSISGE